jgi:asparagine synthase (glutamine-hydrolysing)
MCGILGEFSFRGQLTDQERFLRINRMSARRGPDHRGYSCLDPHCQLGHNRLSILDLSENAHQPMVSPSGRYHIVFNGEVYNHQEIRDRLPRDFYRFKGHSDTETLIVAIECFGFDKVIEWADGMFALGVYDQRERQLCLARDFSGIKPLFYGLDAERIVFASQYDQIAAHPAFADRPIDPQVLKLYLEQHFMPAPFGLLKDTFQVLPGEILRIQLDGKPRKRRYWEFPAVTEPSVFEPKQALETLEVAFAESVRAELLSDVPLGAFLSGGIDSPLVCYFSQQQSAERLRAFTIGSDSAIHDESEDASTYARLIGMQHHLERMDSADAAHIFAEVTRALHEPLADFSIIPTYLVSNLARRDVTVALSGDGGDELFFGYERFGSIAKNIRWQGWPYALKYLFYGTDRVMFKNKHINSGVLSPTQGQGHRGLHSRFPKELMRLIAPGLSSVATPAEYDVYDYKMTSNVRELLGHMRKAEFYGMMQKTLRKVDLASMENSLEVRVPMLKKSLIEASLKIDPLLSFGAGRKKQLLKDLLMKKLPESPIDERKRGFTIPLRGWLREQLREPVAAALLNNDRLTDLGFDPGQVRRMWSAHQSGERDNKWPIFTLYSLLTWRFANYE